MLSDDNPVLSSPQPREFGQTVHPPLPAQTVPEARALRGSSGVSSQDNGYGSPRQELERRAVTPNPPASKQSPFSLNAPKPSLTPFSEYHSGYSDADLESSPCPSPSPFGPSQKQPHRRQQSFPNLFPLALRNQSRTPSPTRKTHQRYPSEQMPYTGEGRIRQRAESPRSGLAGWLSGTAAGSALGMTPNGSDSIDARANDMSNNTSTTPTKGGNVAAAPTQFSEAAPNITPTRPPHRSSTVDLPPPTPKTTTTPAGSTMTSRFMSAFTSRFTTPTTPTTTTSTMEAHDELLSLNIEAALFPPSTTSTQGTDHNSFSPAAFKNFQTNAIGLLTKYQTAYKTQSITIHNLRQEQSAQKDELEEAETRAKHLKFQLENMAKELAEQERKVRALSEELQFERERSKAPSVVLSEDLGVDKIRRHKRRSGESWSGEGEGGEDDEVESAESESVFSSRCRSPVPETPVQGGFPNGNGGGSRLGTPMTAITTTITTTTPRQQHQPKPAAPMNAFQKIFRGVTGEEQGCRNCKGQDASVAWDTVGLLRDENRHLKTRVGELEGVVEGALDLVNGIGM
ncbi:hypothetical protein QBC41DRAFT_105182 [Cercophora samala]|uniref:Uncharacterized protein n=1 Tax=Cercophora samala TaxID=330535 RepID=A0AA40DG83_9PEZI|nr:hypothetical protein QBC41DRAFT_105182 [Cercophora samala]